MRGVSLGARGIYAFSMFCLLLWALWAWAPAALPDDPLPDWVSRGLSGGVRDSSSWLAARRLDEVARLHGKSVER